MNPGWHYTPYIWPMVASAALFWALGVYGWRHRTSPGALAFTAGCLFVGLWAVGNACELSVTDRNLAYWLFRFQMILSTPSGIAALCFVVQYAGLGRWLNRVTLPLLIAPSILIVPSYLLDDARLLWGQVADANGAFARGLAPLGMVWNLYGLAILALTVAVLIRLFVRSPLYRKAAALMLLGHSAIVAVQILEMVMPAPILKPSLMILAIDLTFAMYAVAFFRYGVLQVVPVARESVFERMPDAVVVLDSGRRVADLNLAARSLLGLRREHALGMEARSALATLPALVAQVASHAAIEGEISVGEGTARRWYWVHESSLDDGRGFQLGSIVMLHETTELRLAQERLLQQEHATATLRERERVARELHDGIGQVLGYVSTQVEAVRKLVENDKTDVADTQLERLGRIARDAHADIRAYILELRAAPSEQRPLVASLAWYLDALSQNYLLRTRLDVAPAFDETALTAEAQSQLFRIVQESLTNARKHGGARSVTVRLETEGALMRLSVEDDGSGFDATALAHRDGAGFGLQFMRERAEDLGGHVEVHSAPGLGTRVVVEIPLGRSHTSGETHEDTSGR